MTDIGEGSIVNFPLAGDVKIKDLIGSGGSSFVYSAENKQKEFLAVKIVRANTMENGLTPRVSKEVNNQLSPSPLIIRPVDHTVVLSYGLHVPCILFPHVDGQELADFITNEPPSPAGLKKRLLVAEKMAQALLHVHDEAYIHGDISIKNFLVESETDKVYLIDFETLTHVNDTKLKGRWANSDYMAPEVDQHGGRAISQATDIWSFGLILVEWLAPQVWELDELDKGWAAKFNQRKRDGEEDVTRSIISRPSPPGLEHIWPWIVDSLCIDSRSRPSLKELIALFRR